MEYSDRKCDQNWLPTAAFCGGIILLSQCEALYMGNALRNFPSRVPSLRYHACVYHIQDLGHSETCVPSYSCPMRKHDQNGKKFIFWSHQKMVRDHPLRICSAIRTHQFPRDSDKNWARSKCSKQNIAKQKKTARALCSAKSCKLKPHRCWNKPKIKVVALFKTNLTV